MIRKLFGVLGLVVLVVVVVAILAAFDVDLTEIFDTGWFTRPVS